MSSSSESHGTHDMNIAFEEARAHDKAPSSPQPTGVRDGEVQRYIDRCKEMSEDGQHQWWSRLAEILSEIEPQQEEAVAPVAWRWKMRNTEPGAWDDIWHYGDAKAPYWDTCHHQPLFAHLTPVQKVQESQTVSEDFDNHQWPLGMKVQKAKGSAWHGTIVGFYSTDLTPVGYAVESDREPGSVQIYPVAALEPAPPSTPLGRIE